MKIEAITLIKIIKWFGRVAVIVVSIVLTIMVVRVRKRGTQPFNLLVYPHATGRQSRFRRCPPPHYPAR